MGFLVRSVFMACGLLLFPQQLQAQDQKGTCLDTTTFAGTGDCGDLGSCTAGDVVLPDTGGLLNVEPFPGESCDGTVWFVDALRQKGEDCSKYGFKCNDVSHNFDSDEDDEGDTCADLSGKGLWTFKGVEFTVPCVGTESGQLTVNYCISWKTIGGDNTPICVDAVEVFPSSGSKCDCGPLVIPGINVCPTLDDISVTALFLDEFCEASGTNFDVDFAGIPTGVMVEYTITPQGAHTLPAPTVSGSVAAGSSVTAALYPKITHTVDLEFSYDDGLTCTYELDVTPTCSCEENNSNCPEDEICCEELDVCGVFKEKTIDGMVCGDPHMTGFLGQKFDFTGEDGEWYSVIADSNMHVNMRVTSPVADLPEITYITGLSVLTTDSDGSDHSIVIQVADPHSLDSSCPAGVSPCLADGALIVLVDGKEVLLAPGTVSLGPDVEISAANLPGACRSFGFEKYWERKKRENASQGRRLGTPLSMGEWILGDPTATNMNECAEYVARVKVEEGGVFAHQSEHASFQIVTPKAIIRLSHGRLHQIAMRDPTDRFDLPDHLTWQMNLAIDHTDVSHAAKGILGQTFVPTRDADGRPIMTGFESIRGSEDDYRVEGALGVDFVQDAHTS